jgi:hypothetical protein
MLEKSNLIFHGSSLKSYTEGDIKQRISNYIYFFSSVKHQQMLKEEVDFD